MCGIAGYINLKGANITQSATMLEMLSIQKHRGPDDGGVRAFAWSGRSSEVDHRTATSLNGQFDGLLGFNRLSILDLSQNGHQPMCNASEDVILLLNGEIYNAFDFRDALIRDGYSFRSRTDTEVALNLYLKYGFEKMLTLLNGMFAIAVVDLRSAEMFIARDRFGIKPVYIFQDNTTFAFASEVKSFMHLPGFHPRLDEHLLDEYLLFRNNINQSLFKGIRNLEPGHYVHFSRSNGISTHTFFDVNNYIRPERSGTLSQTQEMLKSELQAAVKRQLLSDVKLGCQLSGGIDSSLVTHYAKHIKQDDLLETISIVFEDKRFSEEEFIDEVAKSVGVKAHKFQLNASYYLNAFEKATFQFEAPLNHPNTIGIYLLSEEARKYVTVLLSGEGADEVFGGYGRFAAVHHPWTLTSLQNSFRRNIKRPIDFVQSLASPTFRTIMSSAFLSPAMAQSLKPDFDVARAINGRTSILDSLRGNSFDKHVKYEIKTYLPDLLMRQDKMSMAHSIENRVPFLDNHLVDAAFSIPEKHLVPNGQPSHTKWALKNIAAEIFGQPFAFRSKQGFGIPLRLFFKDKNFNQYLRDEILPSLKRRNLFATTTVTEALDNLDVVSSEKLDALWIMIAFEAWAKKFKIG